MVTKAAKKHCQRREGEKNNTMAVDRISDLPDSLIHHILSFLPTFYAVRTSILSRQWRHMWIHIPVFYFENLDDVTFRYMLKGHSSTFFVKFMSNYLKHRNLSSQISTYAVITRLKLETELEFFDGVSFLVKLNDWLRSDVNGNLKELDLCIKPSTKLTFHYLPPAIFKLRSLTHLKLKRMKLSINCPVSLPSLKALCLESMTCHDDYSLQNLISGCPIIEDLRLAGFCCSFRKTDPVVSGTLRNLTLWITAFTDQELDYLLCGIPLLEKLNIFTLKSSKNISIRSHSLKSLFLCTRYSTIDAKIMTPNLVSFAYEGQVMSTISFSDAPNLLEANLRLYDDRLNFFHLILFLSYFKCFKKMTLRLLSKQNLIIPENVRNISCPPPLPNLKHLKVKTHDTLERNSELRDAFMWCAPSVETLEIEKV